MLDDEAIWEVPVKRLLLLMREKVYLESDRPGIQLSTMEWIDGLPKGKPTKVD